jgi:ABC-type transporter Mla subunit MlaD
MTRRVTETIVGLFVIIGVIIFVMLYAWLSGKVGLRNTYDINVIFDDVTGLRVGDPVMVYGLEKGKVKSLQIDKGGVRTALAIDRDIMIPEDSEISINSVSIMGADKFVKIIPGKETTIASLYYGDNKTFNLEELSSQFDTLLIMIKDIEMPDFNKIVIDFSRKLDKTTQRISGMFEGPTVKLENLIVRFDSLSTMLKEDGTVGRLLQSDELYQEVRETNQALKDLIEDIKENPKKYISIKVF